jgi:hypothetical protein
VTCAARSTCGVGIAARRYCPHTYTWFVDAAQRLNTPADDVSLQWSTLAKITALTGAPPDEVGDTEFEHARSAIIDAFVARGQPSSGRKPGRDLPPAAADAVPRRPSRQLHKAGAYAAGVTDRLGHGRSGARPDGPPLHRWRSS